MNTFGNLFRITSFGESHGEMMGVVIDGCPSSLSLSKKCVQDELDKRKPNQSSVSTDRKELDQCEIVSGLFEGKTTGAPIAVLVSNNDAHSTDYENIKEVFRPSHADATYQQKYGIRDYRGGGRSSGRETISRVIGGAVAKEILAQQNVQIIGFARAIGGETFENVDEAFIEKNILRMADESSFKQTLEKVESVKEDGDSLGGIVEIRVHNPPAGLGAPVFDKLEADLAKACLSVGAVKGFEIGEGFLLSSKKGSEANDGFVSNSTPGLKTERNANGGILGGISTGEDIWFRVAVKPTSSISKPQQTVNSKGEEVVLEIEGRHDPIIVPRIIPVLEAMTALVLVDHLMMQSSISNFQIKMMNNIKLVFPSYRLKKSFFEAIEEAPTEAPVHVFFDVTKETFTAFLQRMKDFREGKNLTKGWVPDTSYWMVEDGEFIGRISFRHELTPSLREYGGHVGYWIRPSKRGKGYGKKMLGLMLSKIDAKKYPKVLLTCSDDNEASRKMIEFYGGKLEDKIIPKGREELTRRYWISFPINNEKI